MEKKIEEKILWINSNNQELFYSLNGTATYTASRNNFYYNIGNVLYVDNYKKLSVKLIDCVINKNGIVIDGDTSYYLSFNTTSIKIYINFNVASNSISMDGNNLLLGLIQNNSILAYFNTTTLAIDNFYYSDKSSEKLIDNKIKYYLKDIPNGIINIVLYNDGNTVLLDVENQAPKSVLLCLKFTYEI